MLAPPDRTKNTRSVDAKITHFGTYALFTEPVTTTTPTDEQPAEGLPMATILFVIVAIIIAAVGYFFVMKK